MDLCDSCGYIYADQAAESLPNALRSRTARLAGELTRSPRAELVARPLPGTWSALEYACHVRDVLEVQHDRLVLACEEERPRCEPMRREERVRELRYNHQPVGEVLVDMQQNAERLALALSDLEERDWSRVMIYRWPVEAERDLLWLARHTLHELEHHRRDVERVLLAARTARH